MDWVAAGQAWGFYDLGVAHEYGYGGAAMDEAISWAYFRRAAELGSPDAQMALAEAYENAGRDKDALTMRMCAYKQEHGPAAMFLGRDAKLRGDFWEALKHYQAATRFGSQEAAAALMIFFDPDEWNYYNSDKLARLREGGLQFDAERAKRYDEINQALKLNPDLRFSRLDKAIPLPPAELPPWHGIQDAIEPETNDPPTY